MIFIQVINGRISQSDFFCSQYKSMFGINASVKNISRHAKVHIKDYLIEKKESTKNDQRNIFSKEQEDYIAEKISLFIPLSTQTFQYSNDEFLRAQTSSLPTIEENAIINY